MTERHAIVLGAGVIGCSIALTAKAMGYEVEIITDRQMSDAAGTSEPTFASAFPAASVIPHSITADNLPELLGHSEAIFERLLVNEQTGVRKQRHVELFENIEDSEKDYKNSLPGCVDIADIKDFSFPRRQGGSELHGFTFPIYFVDMPFYAKWLEAEVQRQAIKITRQTLTPADAKDLSADVVFNCLGFGASIVAPDLEAGYVARGILLKLPCEGIYASRWNDAVVSYNTNLT